MTISVREFTRNIYQHLKEGEYVVTKNGAPAYVVTIKKVNGVVTEEEVVTKYVHQEIKFSVELPKEYGCGCPRVEKKVLCGKHHRL